MNASPSRSATGPKAHATVVAIYSGALAFGDALLAPELVAGHQSSPLLDTILVRAHHASATAAARAIARVAVPGRARPHPRVGGKRRRRDRETNRWLGPLFVAIIFAFTSIAVVNTLVMIAVRRGRELALLRLTGATNVVRFGRWLAGRPR